MCGCKRGEWPEKWRPVYSVDELRLALEDNAPLHDEDGDCVASLVDPTDDRFSQSDFEEYSEDYPDDEIVTYMYQTSAGHRTGRTSGPINRRLDSFLVWNEWVAVPPVTDDDVQAAINSIIGNPDA